MKNLIKKMLRENTGRVEYSAVILDDNSKNLLLSTFKDAIPEDWKTIAHHMTITFGKGVENEDDLGKEVTLNVTDLGISDMAIAVKVEGYPSSNAIPHVTLAINPNGGKPVMSNKITNWSPVPPLKISGIVTNIMR